jgi:hypothetical protein
MSKRNIIIIVILTTLIIALIGAFFAFQNYGKPKTEGPATKTVSSNAISDNSELQNPIEKNNTKPSLSSDDTSNSNNSNTPPLTTAPSSTSNNSSRETNFTLIKDISEDIKLYKINDFDPTKLDGNPLISIDNFYPGIEQQNYLFIEKDGKKNFLGYGATDTFQFGINNRPYNLTVLEDETGYPFFVLTDSNYKNQRVIKPKEGFSSAKISQKNKEGLFKLETIDGNGDSQSIKIKELELNIKDYIS